MSTHIFIEHLRKAFNAPNSAHDYVLFALLVIAIIGVCAIILSLQRKKRDDNDD